MMSPRIALVVVLVAFASVMLHVECIQKRPPSIPMGADWLANMPRGGEFIPQPSSQPVKEVNYKTCKSGVMVVEYLYAEVGKGNLGKGTATDKKIRDWVKTIGKNKDDAGHIIGNNQGGLGTVTWNIFPQSLNFNRGVYAREVERMVNDAVKVNGVAKMWFRLVYGDSTFPCRPSKFDYYLLAGNAAVSNDLLNP